MRDLGTYSGPGHTQVSRSGLFVIFVVVLELRSGYTRVLRIPGTREHPGPRWPPVSGIPYEGLWEQP